jgi:hypothetical protein
MVTQKGRESLMIAGWDSKAMEATRKSLAIGVIRRFWQFQLHWLWKSKWTAVQFWHYLAVVDDFNVWWVVVGSGVWTSHVGLEGWRRKEEEVLWLEWYEGFGSSDCIDFDSQDELRCNFGPT